jgi:hypothetical protein
VFMGGSLVPHGGQNPIEPAKLGAALLHGSHIHNFADVYAALDAASGAKPIATAEDLAGEVLTLLRHPAQAKELASRAHTVVQTLSGAADKTMQTLEPYLMSMRLSTKLNEAQAAKLERGSGSALPSLRRSKSAHKPLETPPAAPASTIAASLSKMRQES